MSWQLTIFLIVVVICMTTVAESYMKSMDLKTRLKNEKADDDQCK